MAKAKFVKKISNILLAIMLLVSLLLFSACGSFSDDDKDSSGRSIRPTVKLIYRPYSTKEVLLGQTYIDIVYNNILSLSENILTEIVGQYGMGEIKLLGEGGDLVYVRNPNTNGRNYEKMFGVNLLTSPLLTNSKIGEDMGKMAKVSYDHGNKMLILSSHGEDPNILEIATEVIKLATPGFVSDVLTVVGSLGDGTTLYRIDTTTVVHYIFWGGNALIMNGENTQEFSYLATENNGSFDFSNTKTFLKHVLGGNYGVIEKDYISTETIIEGETIELGYQYWNYSLAEGDIKNKLPNPGDGTVVATGNPYLDAYLEKFGLTFAVDIAKSMLVGGDDLPTDVACPKDLLDGNKKIQHTNGTVNLKNLYNKAKSGSNADKEDFIWAASAFVDHLGFSQKDVNFIKEQIKTNIVGESVYSASENSSILKNNYDLFLFSLNGESLPDGTKITLNGVEIGSSAFKNALDQNPTKPILEWISLSNTVSYSEEDALEIPGYLQSIVLMSEGTLIVDAFHMEVEFDESSIIDYVLTPRYKHDSVSNEALFGTPIAEVNEQLSKNTVEIDFSKIEFGSKGELEEVVLSDKTDVLLLPEGTTLVGDFYKCFNSSDEAFPYDEDIYYHAWYFDCPTNYLELVFATKNTFSLTNLNFANFSFWAG